MLLLLIIQRMNERRQEMRLRGLLFISQVEQCSNRESERVIVRILAHEIIIKSFELLRDKIEAE